MIRLNCKKKLNSENVSSNLLNWFMCFKRKTLTESVILYKNVEETLWHINLDFEYVSFQFNFFHSYTIVYYGKPL